MSKINTSPISGASELLPRAQAEFNHLKTKISNIYKQHGFLDIETPCIERSEIIFSKAGGDTEKQIYEVKKTGEKSTEKASQALRFDHTVPLARYIIEHENDLDFPFKVQQTGLNFRGERAQKGRFREFYQCDVDIIGRSKLAIAYDADVISTLLDAFSAFELGTPVLARISNRKILAGLLENLKLTDKSAEIYNIIDHAEKVTPEQTKVSLEELKLTKEQVKTILKLTDLRGSRSKVVSELNDLEIDNPTFIDGVSELDQVLGLLESMDLANQISADLAIIRGLDYYTGTVFEFILPEYKNIGSVCGGGRYDNLTKHFSDKSFPGVGGSIGLTRLFYVLNEHNLLDVSEDALTEYCVIPVSESETEYAFQIADKLHSQGHSATIALMDNKKFSDKMTYAAKVATKGIVVGESEVESGDLKAKDFNTGEIHNYNFTPNSEVNPSDFWSDTDDPNIFV